MAVSNKAARVKKSVVLTGKSKTESELKKLSHDLGERVKELSCLYKISNILNDSSLITEDALMKILEVILPSYQYPDITAARLTLFGKEYKTTNYKRTAWKQSAPVLINGKKIGKLEVLYLKKCKKSFEGPFLKEERHLINSITQLIMQFIIRKKAEFEVNESKEQLKNFAAHLQTIREEERIYISRELHDNLGQSLTALRIDLFRLAKRLSTGEQNDFLTETSVQAKQMISLVDSIILSIRTIARELRPSILDDLGLLAAIEWQIEEFSKRSGIKCKIISSVKTIDVPKAHSIGVFRIVQESLTNILRHSGANKVILKISEENDITRIEIDDNGCGIKETEIYNQKSLGLLGMKERALLFGGEFIIKGVKDKGTKIILSIPKITGDIYD